MTHLVFPNPDLPAPAEVLNHMAEPTPRAGQEYPSFQFAEAKPSPRENNMAPGNEYAVADVPQATPSHPRQEQPVQNSDPSSKEEPYATQIPFPTVVDDIILPKPANVALTATTPVNGSEKTAVTGKETPSLPYLTAHSAAPAASVRTPSGTPSSVPTETLAGNQSESHPAGNKIQIPLAAGSIRTHGTDSKSDGGKLPGKPMENVAVADNVAAPAKGGTNRAQDGNKPLSPYRQGPAISQRHLGTGRADSGTMANDKTSRPVPRRIFGAEKAANAIISIGKPFSQSKAWSLSEPSAGKSNFARIRNTTPDEGMGKILQTVSTAEGAQNRTLVQPAFSTGEGNSVTDSIPELMQKLMKQIEQMQQSGRTLLKLSLELPRGETLNLKVDFRQDQVFVRFVINVPEIRRALEKGWGRLTESASKRGLKLAPPAFDIRRRSRGSLSGTDRVRGGKPIADALSTLGESEPGTDFAAQWSPGEKAGAGKVLTGPMT